MLYDDSYMNKMEYEIYKSLFDDWYEIGKPDKIIYLDTSPEICFQRIEKRRRQGEACISLEYLQKCEKYHHMWFDCCMIQILKIKMDADITYELNDENNTGYKWIQQIIAYSTN
jgi:deoxyadenosine/deoxycytidine kinase